MFMENDPRAVSMHLQNREMEHELTDTKQLNCKLQKHIALLDVLVLDMHFGSWLVPCLPDDNIYL
jgi:hypothetical protein